MNNCIVFVSNKRFFNIFIVTCTMLINNGNYKGNICLVIGDDLLNDELLLSSIIVSNKIIIKHFPNIIFSDNFMKINTKINTDGRNIIKKFQWHKMHLFNVYFKQWEYIFYIDCGMKILSDIKPIMDQMTKNTLLAHSDAYPYYQWKLYNQFDTFSFKNIYNHLSNTYNLNIDYFQTGILLYDTNIIEDNTFNDLMELSNKYPISKTNEQAIMNLYFNCTKKIWKQLPLKNSNTNFYDFCCRNPLYTKYIIVKNKNW